MQRHKTCSSWQRQCVVFIMAVPLGEKPSIISYLACSLPHPAGPCKETQLHFYDSELSASLSAFMDFPFSKSSLCGKSLSSSVGSDKYIWYSCALEQKERKKPLYHNLTAGILYTGIETGGWVACAHQIVSRLARSLALEEMRCGFITQQSNLPLEDRELEDILKKALTCLVCEIPGKILVNGYLEWSIQLQRERHVEYSDWSAYTLSFYTFSAERSIHQNFHFPYSKILSQLFRDWDPTQCLMDIVRRECLADFDENVLITAIERGRAYRLVEYIGVLTKDVQFLIDESMQNGVEHLWNKISPIQKTLLDGPFSIE
jgi:hypothetical protein